MMLMRIKSSCENVRVKTCMLYPNMIMSSSPNEICSALRRQDSIFLSTNKNNFCCSICIYNISSTKATYKQIIFLPNFTSKFINILVLKQGPIYLKAFLSFLILTVFVYFQVCQVHFFYSTWSKIPVRDPRH